MARAHPILPTSCVSVGARNMSLRTPLEIGLGQYMGRYYDSLVADTPAMTEFVERGLAKSIVWVPGRMVDDVEKMIAEYRKNENDPGPGLSSRLPAVFVALAKDFLPAPPEWGVAVGAPVWFTNPDDPEQRAFKVRLSFNEYRGQIVFISPEPHSAHSLATQFNLYANGARRFPAVYEFAGQQHEFEAVLETIDIGAVSTGVDQKNLTINVADLTVRVTVPIFQAPKDGEDNDGKAAPAGYPVVIDVDVEESFLPFRGAP